MDARRKLLKARGRAAQRGRRGYRCPVGPAVEAARLVVGALAAALAWQTHADALGAHVVAAGVDTLELWTAAALRPESWARVEAAQREAVESGEAVELEVGGILFAVHPRWKRTALLETDLYAVKVESTPLSADATVRVEVRALALWTLGYEAAADKAEAVMRALCLGPLDTQVGRVDVCVDWQGWEPEQERSAYTCRAQKVKPHFEQPHLQLEDDAWCAQESRRLQQLAASLAVSVGEERRALLELVHQAPCPYREAEHLRGVRFTGLSWGLGAPVSARAYDKTREIRTSRKAWFREVWRRHAEAHRRPFFLGGDVQLCRACEAEGARRPGCTDAACGMDRPLRPVWRLEFQLRRTSLKTWAFSGEGYTEDLSAWARLKPRLGALWRYLTTSWLRHGRRTAGDRKVMSKAWAQLRDAWQPSAACPSVYREHLEGALKPTHAAAAGYLTSAVAQVSELGRVRPGEGFTALVTRILTDTWHEAEKRTHRTPVEVVEEKREKLRRKAEVLRAREAHRAGVPRWLAAQRPTMEGAHRGLVQRSGVWVKRTDADDVREAQAATLAALEALEELRRAREADDTTGAELRALDAKWTRDELA